MRLLMTKQLVKIMPKLAKDPDKLALTVSALNEVFYEIKADNNLRMAAFLAQLAHESGEFSHLEENLNYSAARLHAVWPSRFRSIEAAIPYAHNAEELANFVYANRMGNGDVSSGDGWRFRGRGPIQITGRAMYRKCGEALHLDLETDPDSVASIYIGTRVAGAFWKLHKLNDLADKDCFTQITKAINGGTEGSESRLAYYRKALSTLKTQSQSQ